MQIQISGPDPADGFWSVVHCPIRPGAWKPACAASTSQPNTAA
jgi:hypothetical protein